MVRIENLLWIRQVGEAVDVLGVVVHDLVDECRATLLVLAIGVQGADECLDWRELKFSVLSGHERLEHNDSHIVADVWLELAINQVARRQAGLGNRRSHLREGCGKRPVVLHQRRVEVGIHELGRLVLCCACCARWELNRLE